MSGRSKKSTVKSSQESVVTRKSAVASPAKSKTVTPVSKPVRERSMSPLSISRLDEKDELAYLNDRLAGYIDYVRQLETDKERLTKRIQTVTEQQIDKSDNIRKTYDKEITALRSLADDLASKRAQLEIEAKTAREDCRDAKSLAQKLEHENNTMEKTIERLERELAACRSDPDRLMKLKKEHDQYKKKCENLRKDLDDQILSRTELENRVTSLKEELDLQKRIWAEERENLVTVTTTYEEQMESKKAAEYESRLAEELREIREQTADELESYKLEMEANFEIKLDQLKAANADQTGEASKLREEMASLRQRYNESNKELSQKISEADLYRRRCNDLENQLSDERKDFSAQMRTLKDEIDRLNEELQVRLKEFTDLLHAKVSLDQEILVYRKMLEGEETRLKIPTPQRSSSFNGSRGGKKRRLDLDEGLEDSLSGSSLFGSRPKVQFAYEVTSGASGDIEFDCEQNGKGKWVRLIHKSQSDAVEIGNWTLVHVADGHEMTYKFPANTTVKKGCTCTVWSKDSGKKDEPPTDIVMSSDNFAAGSNISIRLLDTKGKEQASCTVTRQRIQRSYGRYSSAYRNGTSDEKCSLM